MGFGGEGGLPGKVAVAVAVGSGRAPWCGEGVGDVGVGPVVDRVALSAAEVGGGHAGVGDVDADAGQELGVPGGEHVDRCLGGAVGGGAWVGLDPALVAAEGEGGESAAGVEDWGVMGALEQWHERVDDAYVPEDVGHQDGWDVVRGVVVDVAEL